MRVQVIRRRVAATAAAAAAALLVGGVVVGSGPAAAESAINEPTVVGACLAPHHGNQFSTVIYKQTGSHAANGTVTVTLAKPDNSVSVSATGSTDSAGNFAIAARLVAPHGRSWTAGSTYVWTTEIAGDTWITAQRGTVVVGNVCGHQLVRTILGHLRHVVMGLLHAPWPHHHQ